MNENIQPNPDSPHEGEEQELCTQCMTGNQPGSNFCRQCGAPLSSYAATGPFESLFAEGHLYRRAAEHPQSLLVVLGIWLIFGIMAAGGALLLATSWDPVNYPGILSGIGMQVVSVVLIAKTTRNYRKRRLKKKDDNDEHSSGT
jgi:hypothetical protein